MYMCNIFAKLFILFVAEKYSKFTRYVRVLNNLRSLLLRSFSVVLQEVS
jgi:hypothetical protein